MTNKDFYNALRKAQKSTEINFDNNSGMGKQERKFSQVVSRIKSNPDNEVHVNTVDGSMEACFITLKSQREWFEKYPDINHLDATYKICMENFILYIFLAQDKNLAGVPIAFCLMKTETTGNMEFMYKMFSELFDAKKIKVIMIDKDLQNIEILKRFFPHVSLLLCTFHVIKYLKSIFADYDLDKGEKEKMLQVIFSMIYAKNQKELDASYIEMRKISEPYFVYFESNWKHCESM
jgi:hypothetical protein